MNRYVIRNKDLVVAVIENTDIPSDSFSISSLNRDIPYISRLPFLQSDDLLNNWLDKRQSHIGRRNMVDLFKAAGINTITDYIQVSKCVSLNDTFWIAEEDSKLTWRDVSPYSNPTNSKMSNLAWGIKSEAFLTSSPSPEYSTDGMSMKCWRASNKDIYLLKSEGGLAELQYSNVYSEYFACQVASALGLEWYIKYGISSLHGVVASSCKLFTDESLGFLPIGRYSKDAGHIDDDLEILSSLPNPDLNIDRYKKMLLFDSLIFNMDRHSGNYGFYINNDTYEIQGLAPIFDNDNALFNKISLKGRDNEYIADAIRSLTPRTYIGHSFIEQAGRCITDDMHSQLKEISLSFEFRNHPRYPVDAERLKKMSQLVRWQAKQILRAILG